MTDLNALKIARARRWANARLTRDFSSTPRGAWRNADRNSGQFGLDRGTIFRNASGGTNDPFGTIRPAIICNYTIRIVRPASARS